MQYQLSSPYLHEFNDQTNSLNSKEILDQFLVTQELLFQGVSDQNADELKDCFYFLGQDPNIN